MAPPPTRGVIRPAQPISSMRGSLSHRIGSYYSGFGVEHRSPPIGPGGGGRGGGGHGGGWGGGGHLFMPSITRSAPRHADARFAPPIPTTESRSAPPRHHRTTAVLARFRHGQGCQILARGEKNPLKLVRIRRWAYRHGNDLAANLAGIVLSNVERPSYLPLLNHPARRGLRGSANCVQKLLPRGEGCADAS